MDMQLRAVAAIALVIGSTLGVALLPSDPVAGRDGAEATIAALHTEVADLKATVRARGDKINAQRTTIAGYRPTAAAFDGEPVAVVDGVEVLYSYVVDNVVESRFPVV